MQIAGSILVLIFLSITITGYMLSSPSYQGDKSDHFDGKKFVNLKNVQPAGFRELIKWAMNRKPGLWEDPGQIIVARPDSSPVEKGKIRVTFINHTTFLIQLDGMNILTDPIWSERAGPFSRIGPKRIRPAGIKMEDLPKIDIILLSHNHYDHMDLPSLNKLKAEDNPLVITPLGVSELLKNKGFKNTAELDWWQEYTIGDSFRIACVPAQHFSGRGIYDRDRTLWGGFVLQTASGNLYFAGDTGYGDFFTEIGKKFSPIRVSIIPIGAYLPSWFMKPIHTSPEEAVKIHLDTRTSFSIGSHFGTFPLADDGMKQPVVDLQVAIQKHNLEQNAFLVLGEGESRIF